MAENRVHFFEDENCELVTLTDENGVDYEFERVAGIEYEGAYYELLIPTGEADGISDDEAVILQVVEDENDPEMVDYVSVEDDELQDAVFAEYVKAAETEGYEE
ncbi:MAG: DUF1292 domain-containing protein [Firmicutes bacterium]|nr:DUF1292 domain-containing protein [Bacillota bacterium]